MSRSWGRGQNFPRPENALKRAEELLHVGQKQAALQTLHNVFTGSGRRFRTWSAVYEKIILRHLDLCCDMRKGKYAKEALQQYRNMCQTVSISSLEEVITHFMRKAGEKADEAQVASDAAALDIEDLDVDATPEDIMLSYVSGDKSKDRTDRTMVTPWFRFLWETYRNLLDILRHNSRLQTLYASSIKKAFQFCVTYKRTSEFRRLCELLRSHLSIIQKRAFYGKDQKDRPDLTNVETLQLYVETRFDQLKAACELELWQEAFRSVEDIINLVVINPSIVQPSMMATYYSHLTQIFAFSDESSLYCAYAWYKLYRLAITYNKKLTEADVQMLSSSVLLAALGVCPYNRDNALHREVRTEAVAERLRRMSSILRFGLENKTETAEVYSREALLKELSNDAFLSNVPTVVQKLHHLLDHDFNPLGLCKAVDDLTEQLGEVSKPTSTACPVVSVDLAKHAASLKFVAALKMIKQLSQVYSNMKTMQLEKLVPSMSFGQLEAIIVNAVRNRYIKIRIDHKDESVHFGEDNLDSAGFEKHLHVLAERLSRAQKMMNIPNQEKERQELRETALVEAQEKLEEEHTMALARKQMIEQRKEEQEQFLLEKERAEERKRKEQTQQALAAENQRRQQEAERREQERLQRELEEKEMAEAKELLEKGNKKYKPGQKLDKQKILQEVLTEQIKEQQELDRRLQKMQKTLDHLERAFREEEAPLILRAEQDRIAEENVLHEQESVKQRENHFKTWEIDVAEKGRLTKMLDDQEDFAEIIRHRRHEEFEERRKIREKEARERRDKRRKEKIQEKIFSFAKECREKLIAMVKKEEEERKKNEKEEEDERIRATMERKAKEKEREIELQRKREMESEQKKELEKKRLLAESDGDRWTRSGTGGGTGGGGSYVPPVRTNTSNDRWERKPLTPPRRGPGQYASDHGNRERWDDSGQRPPRSPLVQPQGGNSAGFVPSDSRSKFEDNRPPPSRPDSHYTSGGDDRSWRQVGKDRSSKPSGGSSSSGGGGGGGGGGNAPSSNSGAYVPPGRRQQQQHRDRDRDKDRDRRTDGGRTDGGRTDGGRW